MCVVGKSYKRSVSFYINAQEASPGPPVGTILGNTGINTSEFCTAFNNYTAKLPYYFALKVIVYVYENDTFTFEIKTPSTGAWIKRLRFSSEVEVFQGLFPLKKLVLQVYALDLLKLALFKFPKMSLKKSFRMIWGSAKSQGLKISY